MDEQIDVRGDGRIVLYRRSDSANSVYHVRLRIPGSNGYKRLSTKHSKRRDAEHFALNLYEELYFHIRDGGSLNAPKFSKAFDAWKKACAKKKTTLKKGSWENTIQRVEMYALEYFGDTQIDEIGKKEISSYVTWRYLQLFLGECRLSTATKGGKVIGVHWSGPLTGCHYLESKIKRLNLNN
ncbi:hypothetical protein OAU68_02380 [Litorivicinus sp.]|nr:hypothetical protein [Litorivicinus sp.]